MMNNQTDNERSIWYWNIYINLFYVIFGNIGNLFKIFFFLQKPLRNVPCTIYILISTLSDFITLNNLPILQLLTYFYPNYHWIKITIDWSIYQNETIVLSYSISNYDRFICKICSYLHIFSIDLSFQMLLFASINRFCSNYRRNSIHYILRYFWNYSTVYKFCLLSSLITACVSLQHALNFTICSRSIGCVPSNPIIWISSFHCFLLPLLIIIFSMLILKTIGHLSIFKES